MLGGSRSGKFVCASVLAVALGAPLAGCGGQSSTHRRTPDPAVLAVAVVAGVPQRGNTLGASTAPVTGQLFLRLDSIDGNLVREVVPALVSSYVRPGRLKLQLRTLTGIATPDAPDGGMGIARSAQAIGLHDGRLWPFALGYATSFAGTADPATERRALIAAGLARPAPEAVERDARVTSALRRAARLARSSEAGPPSLVLSDGVSRTTRIDLADFPDAARVLLRVRAALEPGA